MTFGRVALLCAASAFLACPAPGEGAKAERGYRRAAPVIAALQRFHATTDSYPQSLLTLIPQYLDSAAAPAAIETQESPLGYVRSARDFELSFRYGGPGINECTYRSVTGLWKCSGHF